MTNVFSIFNYSLNRFEEIVGRVNASCEEICINFANQSRINPVARLLFGLRVHHKTIVKWIPNHETLDPNLKYEFRLRFHVQKPTINLKKLDITTYKYFYYQISWDLVHGKIDDIKYPKHKDSVLGLGAVMMCIDHIERKSSSEELKANYKRYLPKQLAKNHPYFARQKILTPLNEMLQKNYDIFYVLKIYIDAVLKMAPNYIVETYDAEADCLAEDNLSQKSCPIKVQVNMNHELQPGLWIYYQYRDEWVNITPLDGIYSINCYEHSTVNFVLAGQAKAFTLKFKNNSQGISDIASFVTCVAGYYRLSVKWMQDICMQYPTPTLDELKSLKCHGPIGADFSYNRIKEVHNKSGAYILRQCEREYESYRLDINRKGIQTETFLIKRKSDKWQLLDFNDGLSNSAKEFDHISDLIKSIETDGDKFCIHPSEYDKPAMLLLCSPNKQLKTKKVVTDVNEADLKVKGGRIFDFHTDLQLYISSKTLLDNGKITEMPADWILSGEKQIKVSVKICNSEANVGDFLKLSNNWSKMYAPEFIKLYGVTLSMPLSMVMEYAPFGQLQQFLQKEKDSIPFCCLLEAVYSLVRAIIYLQENRIVHTEIRCSNLFVTRYEPKSNILVTKLGDPGLQKRYGIEDFPWIPIEYDGRLELAKSDPTTQHWAFATTIWEIFNRGRNLKDEPLETFKNNYNKSNLILPIDEDFPPEICKIISEGWSPQHIKEKRFNTQLIFQRLNNIKDYQLTQCEHSMSSTTSIWTMSESSNTSQNNVTCSLSHTSSTCSLHKSELFPEHEPLINCGELSCTQYRQSDYNEFFKSFHPQRYVHELKFGKLIVGEIIGEGHYGSVRKGEIQFYDSSKPPCQVAIKTLKNSREITRAEFEDFRQEIEIMKQLKHENIVRIIANIYEPEISIIMEYIECNSFTVYLKSEKNLEDIKLLMIARDVAEGMKYLQNMNIIHRDLAARNILIDNSRAKISDFGLARVADSYGFYKVQTMDREIPVKWYSPETIETNTFSFYSDVWSFGVTLFEMFSRGETPYLVPGQEISPTELLNRLNNGERLKKPACCPVNIYHKLLLPCWNAIPNSRPDFQKIITIIAEIINSGEFTKHHLI